MAVRQPHQPTPTSEAGDTRRGVSIVVPTYNRPHGVTRVLASLAPQLAFEEDEVLVSDDGTTDVRALLAAVNGSGLPARLVTGANAGPAAARNRGACAARGAYLLFVDDDCYPTAGWLKKMKQAFAEGAEFVFGAVSSGITIKEPFLHAFEMHGDVVPGANVGCTARVFEALGGFDERLANVGEDQDFGRRATAAGHTPKYVDALVIHPPRVKQVSTAWAPVEHDKLADLQRYFEKHPEQRGALVRENRTLLAKGLAKALLATPLGVVPTAVLATQKWLAANDALRRAGFTERVPGREALAYALSLPFMDLRRYLDKASHGMGDLK